MQATDENWCDIRIRVGFDSCRDRLFLFSVPGFLLVPRPTPGYWLCSRFQTQQHGETRLRKMMIASQSLRQPLIGHHQKGKAVGQ